MPELPLDIIEQILALLGHSEDDREALKSCSLASHQLLQTSQRHLFRRINVSGLETNFHHLLTSAPHLIPYIRELCLDFRTEYGNTSHMHAALPSALGLLAGKGEYYSGGAPLREITLKHLDWDAASVEMQTALINLLSCETLQHVMLWYVRAFPMSIVKHFPPGLKSLNLNGVSLRPPSLSQAPSLPKNILGKQVTHLESLTLIDSLHTVTAHGYINQLSYKFVEMMFDTTHLRAIGLALSSQDVNWAQMRDLIESTSKSLEQLFICIESPHAQFPLDLSQFPRLQDIHIHTGHYPRSHPAPKLNNVLVLITRFLNTLVYDNAIRYVTISCNITEFTPPGRIAGALIWEGLDLALTRPQLTSDTFRAMRFRFNDIEVWGQEHQKQPLADFFAAVHAKLPRIASSKKLHIRELNDQDTYWELGTQPLIL
ncbi:hypothetical protein AX17_002956 [Amanita inopinata Kibby_2008]|nr:hypothetical protein AX17_002956 [Amanita inopinata Kibby_2008]